MFERTTVTVISPDRRRRGTWCSTSNGRLRTPDSEHRRAIEPRCEQRGGGARPEQPRNLPDAGESTSRRQRDARLHDALAGMVRLRRRSKTLTLCVRGYVGSHGRGSIDWVNPSPPGRECAEERRATSTVSSRTTRRVERWQTYGPNRALSRPLAPRSISCRTPRRFDVETTTLMNILRYVAYVLGAKTF